jgi:hypothetical protein
LNNTQKWMAQGLCAGMSPELAERYFFPTTGQKHPALARRLCQACPVQPQCAAFGADEEYGLWGGTTPLTRGTRRHGAAA